MKQKVKQFMRWRRHRHIRKRVIGTPERPRLCIFKSHKHIYCQIIDDTFVNSKGNRCGKTIAACSTLTPDLKKGINYGGNIKAASVIGENIAKMAQEKGVKKITFDRSGYKYHGRVKAFAEAARKAGLEF